METLTEFLLARIAEDEAVARSAGGQRWSASVPRMVHADSVGRIKSRYVASVDHAEDQEHIARTSPGRVRAECEAKRRIVARITDGCPHGIPAPTPERPDRRVHPGGWCIEHCDAILLDLALPYADHPDYRDEWRG